MSRVDKRVHRERVIGTAKDESVRFFAFANTRPGYQVVFSPEQPIIILKTKKAAAATAGGGEQHPCAQWEPFSELVFHARPNSTHAVYVADITAVCARLGVGQEECVNGAAVGSTLKQLGNAVARLNPHNATLVAAGVSAHLALKYVLVGEKMLGHRDRLVEKVVLVCPSSLEELTRLTDATARVLAVPSPNAARDPCYPKPSVVVLVKGGKDVAAAYHSWLSSCADLFADFSVDADLSPGLFAAVARHALPGGVGAVEGTVDTASRFEHPRVYRIDFVLSKASKNVEQFPVLSPLDTAGFDDEGDEDEEVDAEAQDEDADTDEESEDEAGEEEGPSARGHVHGHSHGDGGCDSCCKGDEGEEEVDGGSSMYVSGVTSLQQWKEPVRIMLEGRVLDLEAGLVGTTEGCVVVEGLAELVAADRSLAKVVVERQRKKNGAACVALATRLLRDAYGRTTLKALEVRALTKQEEKRSMTAGSSLAEIPLAYNVSAIAHSYGAVLVRGRKCALVREVGSGKVTDMFLPHQPLADSMESGTDCAVRALCEACDVSSDNFYLPSYLAPVVYYTEERDEEKGVPLTRCVTLYVALAVSPPPRGPASDAREDKLDPKEPYDWVGFERALSLLATEGERAALREVELALKRATKAGLYRTFAGCGAFGDGLRGGAASVSFADPCVSADGSGGGGRDGDEDGLHGPARDEASVSLAEGTVELVVLLCPGCRAVPDALADAARATLGVPGIVTYDGESEGATLSSAAEGAVQAGRPIAAVFLNQHDVDVDDFCEEQLLDLRERRGLRSRFVSVLTPSVCDKMADLTADVAERAALMDSLLAAARVSDVLCLAVAPPFSPSLVSHPAEAEQVLWALLSCCAEANEDLTILRGWQGATTASGAERLSLEEIKAMAAKPSASAVKYVRISLADADKPVAPAALHFLTRPGSLSAFFVKSESFLLSLEGIVWVATRPEAQGVVSLDVTNTCLTVDGGDSWRLAAGASRHTALQFDVLCGSDEAAATARATATELLKQLAWDPDRDGGDIETLKDPLLPWDE